MNAVQHFIDAAERYADKPALIHAEKSLSYAALHKEVATTAGYFHQKGIGSGDRVLILVPVSTDLYRIVLALLYIGAVAVFMDEWVLKKDLKAGARLAACKGFIGTRKASLLRFFHTELREIPIRLNLQTRGTAIGMKEPDPAQEALLTFTTGSTGKPKAVVRSHKNLIAQTEALIYEIQPRAADVDCCTLPIPPLLNLAIGAATVLPHFRLKNMHSAAEKLNALLRQSGASRFTTSPAYLLAMIDIAEKKDLQLAQPAKIITGGAVVFSTDAIKISGAFPAAEIRVLYGSSEAEPMAAVDVKDLGANDEIAAGGVLAGHIHPSVKAAIIKIRETPLVLEEGQGTDTWQLKEGEVGEIVVTGPHVVECYVGDESEFYANKIKQGSIIWHRTGDSGFIRNGQLFLTGRCAQVVVAGDQRIWPFLVDANLRKVSGVSAAAALQWDGRIYLLIESRSVTADVIRGFAVNIPHDVIKILPAFRRDPRHRSRIDFVWLHHQLDKE